MVRASTIGHISTNNCLEGSQCFWPTANVVAGISDASLFNTFLYECYVITKVNGKLVPTANVSEDLVVEWLNGAVPDANVREAVDGFINDME